MLDVVERKGDDASAEVEEINGLVADEGGQRQVAGEGLSSEAADDDLFVSRGHKDLRIVAWKRLAQQKRCKRSSQFANAVLHWPFAFTCHDHYKRLIRGSLGMAPTGWSARLEPAWSKSTSYGRLHLPARKSPL